MEMLDHGTRISRIVLGGRDLLKVIQPKVIQSIS